jgi:hypothetical protein
MVKNKIINIDSKTILLPFELIHSKIRLMESPKKQKIKRVQVSNTPTNTPAIVNSTTSNQQSVLKNVIDQALATSPTDQLNRTAKISRQLEQTSSNFTKTIQNKKRETDQIEKELTESLVKKKIQFFKVPVDPEEKKWKFYKVATNTERERTTHNDILNKVKEIYGNQAYEKVCAKLDQIHKERYDGQTYMSTKPVDAIRRKSYVKPKEEDFVALPNPFLLSAESLDL